MAPQTWTSTWRCPGEPWSQNEERRWVWQQTRRRSSVWHNFGVVVARSGPWPRPLPRTMVTVTLIFRQHRRRDPMNYVSTVGKALIDGMVRGGLWPDDTPEWVLGPMFRIEVDKSLRWPEVKVSLRLMPVEEDEQ